MENEISTGTAKQLKSKARMQHATIVWKNSDLQLLVRRKQGRKRGRKGRLSYSRMPRWGCSGEPDCDPQALHVDAEKEKERNPPSR